MTTHSLRVLCVDDDTDTSELISLMLLRANADYDITTVKSVLEALWLARTKEFDLFVLDYRYPLMTGVDLCRTIRLRDKRTPIMFFTGEAHERERREALEAGADAYLIKPTDLNKLTETAKQLLGAERLTPRRAARSPKPAADSQLQASAKP